MIITPKEKQANETADYFRTLAKSASDFASEYNDYLLYEVAEEIIDEAIDSMGVSDDKKNAFYTCLLHSFSESVKQTKMCLFCPHNRDIRLNEKAPDAAEIEIFETLINEITDYLKNRNDDFSAYNADIISDLKILVEDSFPTY